jgi:hypothetical protein
VRVRTGDAFLRIDWSDLFIFNSVMKLWVEPEIKGGEFSHHLSDYKQLKQDWEVSR